MNSIKDEPQVEIEKLFKRINKDTQKNGKYKISDDDLNKVRAFAVQSQRPLQAVRLLQKEREERETDEAFTQQKEDIIKKARLLDVQREEYKEEKKKIIQNVTNQTKKLELNSTKRKKFVEDLAREQNMIDQKVKELRELEQRKHRKDHELKMKENEIEQHKPFTEFLESVIKDKSAVAGESFSSIEEVIFRYRALKETNKDLVNEKQKISYESEELSIQEKQQMNQLKKKLYEEERKRQQIQAENEAISSQIYILDKDFETGIQQKNQNSRDIGQIINSINNIYFICQEQQIKKRKNQNKGPVTETPIKEDTKDLVEKLTVKLESVYQTIDELNQVHAEYGKEYSREVAYAKQIDWQVQDVKDAEEAEKKKLLLKKEAPKTTNQGNASTIAGDQSTGMKTGKLSKQLD